MLITNHSISVLLLLALLATTFGARADIYAFTDADGVRHFTNIAPADSRYKRIIRSRETEPGYRFPSTSPSGGQGNGAGEFPVARIRLRQRGPSGRARLSDGSKRWCAP